MFGLNKIKDDMTLLNKADNLITLGHAIIERQAKEILQLKHTIQLQKIEIENLSIQLVDNYE